MYAYKAGGIIRSLDCSDTCYGRGGLVDNYSTRVHHTPHMDAHTMCLSTSKIGDVYPCLCVLRELSHDLERPNPALEVVGLQ